MMGYDNGWGWGSWLAMTLMMLLLIGVIAWAIFLLWRSTGDSRQGPSLKEKPEAAEEILAGRLARSEIDVSEYEERLEALGGRSGAGEQ